MHQKKEFSLLIDSLTTEEGHSDIFYYPVLWLQGT